MKSLTEVQQEFLTGAFQLIVPEAALIGMGCVLFLLGLVRPGRSTALAVALTGVVAAAVLAALLGPSEVTGFWKVVEGTSYQPRSIAPFDPTGPAAFIRWLSLGAAAVFLLLAWPEVQDENVSEYSACVLILTAGASLVGRANDLIALFLALELVSIPTYVLLYLPARGRTGQEAALKYFLLSVLSSAVLLFGFSYLYGLTGSTNIGAMARTLTEAHQVNVGPLALVAILMVVAGLGFRVTAFPFHWYAPDVYEGGPTGVVAQLSFVPKVVGFVALARLLGMFDPPTDRLPFDTTYTFIPLLLGIISAVTMCFGNLMALLQDNLKRLLAYSGIAHGGYMLLGLVVACSLPDVQGQPAQTGLDSLLFYLVAYGLMTVGAFAILQYLGNSAETVDDLAGVGLTHPVSAAALAVLVFSLIGLPLTAGFAGKLLLFVGARSSPTTGAVPQMNRILTVIAAVNAAIGAVYYLRIIGVMYLRTPLRVLEPVRGYPALLAALACAVVTLGLGVYPKPLADAARAATPFRDDQPRPAVADAGTR